MPNPKLETLDPLISLCKRRGFIFQSSEIYGGLNGFWDYGPLGVELRRRILDAWWNEVVRGRDDVVGYDASIIMHPEVWRSSGHVDSFYDLMVDCRECNHRFRLDHLIRDAMDTGTLDEIFPGRDNSTPPADDELPTRCPDCGGELTAPRQFGLMFETHVGAAAHSKSVAYLRPETAQAMFVSFRNVQTSTRMKVPFGIAQVGKAFRNEVTPRNFTFRSREFEQMELEFFVHPDEEDRWFEYWVEHRHAWYASLGVKQERLRLRPHGADELAHYAKGCMDVEYEYPFGWQELEGIANRGTYDLEQHMKGSSKNLAYADAQEGSFVPSVIESSAGLDRTLLTVLTDAFDVDEIDGEERTVLHLAPHLAPRHVSVFPLVKKLTEPAQKLSADLRRHFDVLFDVAGSIGKRYRREDEVGTPFCVTVDFDSLDDGAVTVRDRDTTGQTRVAMDSLVEYLRERLGTRP